MRNWRRFFYVISRPKLSSKDGVIGLVTSSHIFNGPNDQAPSWDVWNAFTATVEIGSASCGGVT
ncbi:MAG: hypothetical protein ACI9JM_000188 [Halioglobus sp.]|jgi:hypothetical protein